MVIFKFWPEEAGPSAFALLPLEPSRGKPLPGRLVNISCCICPGFLLSLGRHMYGTLLFWLKVGLSLFLCRRMSSQWAEKWQLSGYRSKHNTLLDVPLQALCKHHQFDFYNCFLMNCYGKKPGIAMTSAQSVNSSWPQEALMDLGQVLWWDLCLKLNKPFSILITGHGELFMDSVIQPCCCGLGLEVLRCDCWQEIYCKILRWSVHRSVSSAHTLELN